MQQQFRKLRRVHPVILARQSKVDQETAALMTIQNEKRGVVTSMRTAQQKYMHGIAELNKIRATRMRDKLDPMEEALDFVKEEWYRLFLRVQEIERQEKAQIAQVLVAERELKATQKLREKYEIDFKKSLAKNDQKLMDEIGLRKFRNGN